MNIILNTDSYKTSHYKQYPPNTEYVYSYIESRGGEYDYTVFFGLQIFIKEYLTKPITQDNINEAENFFLAHGVPFNKKGWQYILDEHDGFLPLQIDAVPEGCLIPTKNVLANVVNTDPKCFWLTSYIETALLRAIWYGTTVATQSHSIKTIIKETLVESSTNIYCDFKLHDFGARGVSSIESAGIGGAAHLVNFKGSDTIEGSLYAMKYYDCSIPGFSIPAAEHSTITSWGKEREVDAYRNMLNQFGHKGHILAVVSDSYDLFNAIENLWGGELKQEVIDSGATIVIRPDSGDPVEMVLKTIQKLMDKFGYSVNKKGYKELPSYIRVIQGDGINEKSIKNILNTLLRNAIAADNVGFGMGGALLQCINRDTLRFAMKCSAIKNSKGTVTEVYKNPITDPSKKSKKGLLKLVKDKEVYKTVNINDTRTNELKTVYYNGHLTLSYTFEEVRENANRKLNGID